MCTANVPTLVQYWHNESIPGYIQDLLATFRDHNPSMRHLVFDEDTATEFIARNYGERELRAFHACAVPAMQADYFRYCAVLALGGAYSDADYRCIGSLQPLVAEGGRLFWRPQSKGVINALFGFGAPGHKFLALAMEIATANIEHRLCNRVFYTTGPPIFETLHLAHKLGSFDSVIEHNKGRFSETFVRFYCEVVDDHARIGPALEGIKVRPIEEASTFVCNPPAPLPYKASDTHWLNFKGKIFR